MKLFKNFKITNRGLYWGLIICFALLYLFVGFVSTLHSITFFNLANSMGLAVLLGITYEVGQASVLFSILMSKKNQSKFLPWALMILLTALQVTANVFASFKYMATSGSTDYIYWQKSILIGVQAANPEMYQVIISWIAGALLPVVALGMTALVAQNLSFMTEESEAESPKVGSVPDEDVTDIINNEVDKKVASLISTAKIADLEKPSEYVDFDETGIGGRDLTPEEEQQLSDYLDEEMELMTDVQSNVVPEPGPEVVKKKTGRPPKLKESVAGPKKEQELLRNEEVKAPKKENILVNPLEIPSEPIKPVKTLEEAFKPSKGDEVIALIEKEERAKVKEPIIQLTKDEEMDQESLLVPPELRTPYLDGGVEVIDAKVVPKIEEKKT